MKMPEFDLSKGNLPVLIVVSSLIAVGIGGVYFGRILETNEVTRRELKDMSQQVQSLKDDISSLTQLVNAWRPQERWTTTDQIRFCYEAERANPGWKCPIGKEK